MVTLCLDLVISIYILQCIQLSNLLSAVLLCSLVVLLTLCYLYCHRSEVHDELVSLVYLSIDSGLTSSSGTVFLSLKYCIYILSSFTTWGSAMIEESTKKSQRSAGSSKGHFQVKVIKRSIRRSLLSRSRVNPKVTPIQVKGQSEGHSIFRSKVTREVTQPIQVNLCVKQKSWGHSARTQVTRIPGDFDDISKNPLAFWCSLCKQLTSSVPHLHYIGLKLNITMLG